MLRPQCLIIMFVFIVLQATTNDIPAMTKDYSIDLQHLVLLHGFQLQGMVVQWNNLHV